MDILIVNVNGYKPLNVNDTSRKYCWKRKTFFVFESHVYRSVWAKWGRYSEKSEFAGRRKRIESESRSGILYKTQEKAMEKTITKLCLMLAMLHLVGMADGVPIASKVHSSKEPVITYFGLHNATGIAFIGNNINLTCTMENADLGTFLKSGNLVVESERVTYFFQASGNKMYANLEISDLNKDDSGVYTCAAYKAGIVVTSKFVLNAVPYPSGVSARSNNTRLSAQ
ncbi:uncharacterized protein LOC122964354 isoform X2 [Acropora millepora]|uniref:uncharacterized protein LOC122964354 isoform X2 n=1 Tax=Acropora millepora TaxID=45264 RepID=UPI001CF32D5E|nr:uncharacterized protein LOC122964354 isoform X2 [Acropora millepora]